GTRAGKIPDPHIADLVSLSPRIEGENSLTRPPIVDLHRTVSGRIARVSAVSEIKGHAARARDAGSVGFAIVATPEFEIASGQVVAGDHARNAGTDVHVRYLLLEESPAAGGRDADFSGIGGKSVH